MVNEKIEVIQGDMLKPNLAISPDDEEKIIQNVNVIINSAASVDFNAKLLDSLQINVLGTLKMFYLGQKCKNFENFV